MRQVQFCALTKYTIKNQNRKLVDNHYGTLCFNQGLSSDAFNTRNPLSYNK